MHFKILVTLFLIITLKSFSQEPIKSPFNKQSIQLDSTNNYKFIVSGHFHGSGTNKTGYPTNTILANLDWINNSDANMMVCLGDLFLDVDHDIPFYEKSFFSKLNVPLYNTVGNHDLTANIYQENFGETFFYFEINNDVHLFFDTEIDDGSLENEQLEILKTVASKSNKYENVFIYSHRTVWAKSYKELDRLFQDNTQSLMGNNFESEVKPLLKDISDVTNLYWFSGSLGDAPASFFNFKDDKINYIGTAIRGLPRDAVLIVNVVDDKVNFELKSFTGQELLSLSHYDVAYWEENVGIEPFNYRLLPYYFKLMITHRYFWIGLGSGLLLVLFYKVFVSKLLKRIKKR